MYVRQVQSFHGQMLIDTATDCPILGIGSGAKLPYAHKNGHELSSKIDWPILGIGSGPQ